MVIHIRKVKGKGGKDRDVPMCPKLLEPYGNTGDGRKPRTWLFPINILAAGTVFLI
jgi:hypothetical protein